MDEIKKLKQIAISFGGDIIESSCHFNDATIWPEINGIEVDEDDFYISPFSSFQLGIVWKSKIVIYYGKVLWPEVIHEMGHIFCSHLPPNKSSEWQFFGWEYCLAMMINSDMEDWYKSNSNYNTEDIGEQEFGSLSHIKKQEIINERIEFGKEIGIIDSFNRPLSLLNRSVNDRATIIPE